MNKANRLYGNIHIRNTVYTATGVGVMANALLLLVRVSLHMTGHRPKPTDLPIGLLALIHLVILLIKGFIASDIFTPQGGRWDDLTCQLLIYLYRLMRGFSICATCLLSVLQAITLSPRSSCLAKFKHKSSRHNLCLLLFLWVIYSSFSSHLFISLAATPNRTSDNFMYVTESCSFIPMTFFLRHSLSTLLTFREVSFIGIMALSSGYMVALLCRHKRQSRYLHSSSPSPVSSPELRATQTILLLLSCFVVMSILDSAVSYARITLKDDPVFYCIQILVAHSYASFSPLVFICTEKRIIVIFRGQNCPPVRLHHVAVTLPAPPPPSPPYRPLETPGLRWPLSSLRGGVARVLLTAAASPQGRPGGSRPLPVRASPPAQGQDALPRVSAGDRGGRARTSGDSRATRHPLGLQVTPSTPQAPGGDHDRTQKPNLQGDIPGPSQRPLDPQPTWTHGESPASVRRDKEAAQRVPSLPPRPPV
ncbi:vomeronasal type-1 receptor 48-like [Ictidomys tridecemlineatus]